MQHTPDLPEIPSAFPTQQQVRKIVCAVESLALNYLVEFLFFAVVHLPGEAALPTARSCITLLSFVISVSL